MDLLNVDTRSAGGSEVGKVLRVGQNVVLRFVLVRAPQREETSSDTYNPGLVRASSQVGIGGVGVVLLRRRAANGVVLASAVEVAVGAGHGDVRVVEGSERIGVINRLGAAAVGNVDLERVGDGARRDGAVGSPVPVRGSQAGRSRLVRGAN